MIKNRIAWITMWTVCIVSTPSAAQSFEPGTCYRAQFCGVWTGRNTVCSDTGPPLVGECIVVEYDVRADGVVVNENIFQPDVAFFAVAAGTVVDGCNVEGGGGFNFRNGISIRDVSFSPGGGITATGDLPGTDPNAPDFEMVSGSLSGTNLELTIAGGIGRVENIVYDFETTFCNQENCGNCDEPFGDGEPPDLEPETFIRWNTTEGEFGLAANWDPDQVPTANEVAVFESPGAVSVVSISSATSRRAEIREGQVDLVGGSYTLVHDSLSNRSLVVGSEDRGETAVLILENHVLSTVHTAVGLPGATDFSAVNVNAGSIWNNMGRLSVGLGSTGLLRVEPGGELVSAETRIGDSVGGADPSLVFVGTEAASGSALAALGTGNLAVGLEGEGALTIHGNAVVASAQQVTIGDQPGSFGEVAVESGALWELGGDVLVGTEGEGLLTVIDNELVIPGDLDVGRESTGLGTVEAVDNSNIQVGGTLDVGTAGSGQVIVDGGLMSASAFLGVGVGGEGNVTIAAAGALWSNTGNIVLGTVTRDANGELGSVDGVGNIVFQGGGSVICNLITVNAGSSIRGSGGVAAAAVLCEGTLDPSVVTSESGALSEKQVGSNNRVLEIEGTLTLDGGVVDATIDGAAVGQLDQVAVTGDATLSGTTIRLRFAPGFTPGEGDDFPVLTATGTLTTNDVVIETEGLDESLEVVLTNENGVLTLTTVSAAEQGGGGGGCFAASPGLHGEEPNTGNVPAFVALILAGLMVSRSRRRSKTHR